MSESNVRHLGVSEARANMTEVISEARLLDVDFVLTRRDKPQAVLISVKRYGSANVERHIVERLREEYPDVYERLITEPDVADKRAARNIAES